MRIAGLVLAAVLASAAPAEAAQLVRYEMSGGFAGRSVRLVVDDGGAARQTEARADAKRFTVSSSQLRALKRELRDARFSTLKHRYKPNHVVNDGISQGVTYKGRTVTVSTGGDPPARLRKVLSRLARLTR